jgi:hypothetical protein
MCEAGIYDRIRTHQARIGDVLLSVQRQGEAEVEFTRAIAIGRQQQAKSWELRAARIKPRVNHP